MKNQLIKNKDIYNNVYYSLRKIDVEKLFDQLYGMFEPIQYKHITSQDTFLLQLQTIEYLSSMEKGNHSKAIDNIKVLKMNFINDEELVLLNDALEKQANSKYIEAHQKYRQLLNKNSMNRLAYFALHMMEFNLGWQKEMLETSQIVVNSFKNKNHSYYGYAKGIEAFSLIENGFFEKGKCAVEVALKINKRDIYAIHAMCHYYYETGKYQEGIKWMELMKPYWIDNSGMRIHVWWHLAVFHLFNLNMNEVKSIFLTEIAKKNRENGLEDLDATALLWRLYLLDENNFQHRKTLTNWNDYISNNHFIFNDLHALIAYILNDDIKKIEFLIHQIKLRKQNPVTKSQSDLLYGFYEFAKHNYYEASKKLAPLLNNTNFGGSNAQRDIIHLTFFVSLLKSNNLDDAYKILETCRVFKYSSKLKDKLITMIGGNYH
ncbi:hypothetical protein [Staphylococcus caeli]|uniref:hypothetical protein n=1 Tax=Staphylococcus caeli TaxID=2201815 RepID=UPI003F560E0D